jgi:hypothetical protein
MSRRRRILWIALAALLLLGGALAWRIHTWGQPLAVVYEPRSLPPEASGSGHHSLYQPRGEGRLANEVLEAIDTDGDGTVDEVLSTGKTPVRFLRPRPDDSEARWLVLCLDGVPYEEMRALWDEGHFREFFRPVPVIAPFPSASGLALSALFHTAPVAGYEDGYFDRARNELSGGALKTSTQADLPYAAMLDYDLPGWSRGLAYVMPVKGYRADLGRLRTRFRAWRPPVYVAHIATTDSLYHVVPRAEARQLLLEIEALLREFYFDARGKLRITVFSDHGNSLVPNRAVRLRQHLESRGWTLASRLGGPRAVVVPAYGLMGFLAAYCQPEARAALARGLAALKGVDVVVFADGDAVVVESSRGHARVEWTPDAARYRYVPARGDPLELKDIVAALKFEKKLDKNGWAGDADWLAATAEHRYPDALHRLRGWATNHVRNRAEVVASLEPGFHQGSRAFDLLVTMLSTHGSFDRGQSLGFAMSTDAPLASAVRNEGLLPKELREREPH